MSVRAKFQVTSFTTNMGSTSKLDANGKEVRDARGNIVYVPTPLYTVNLSPVYHNNDPEHENSKFWRYSPSGSISLGTVNPAAAGYFQLGKEYYIDFTEAPGADDNA